MLPVLHVLLQEGDWIEVLLLNPISAVSVSVSMEEEKKEGRGGEGRKKKKKEKKGKKKEKKRPMPWNKKWVGHHRHHPYSKATLPGIVRFSQNPPLCSSNHGESRKKARLIKLDI